MEGKKILFILGAVVVILYVLLTTIPRATDTSKSMHDLDEFLRQDTVSENKYVDGVYNCFNFSRDLKSNAEAKGFNVHLVFIGSGPTDHSIVLFELENENVFVEPEDDSIINNIFDTYQSETFVTIWI